METFRRALTIIDGVVATHPNDETANRMLATATHRMQLYIFLEGEKARAEGKESNARTFFEEAMTHARRSRETQEKVLSMKPENPLYQRNVAGGKLNEGKIYRELGDTETALRLAREALAIQHSISENDPNNQEIRLDMKESYEDMAFAFVKRGDSAKASESFIKAVELTESLLRKDPENFDFWLARVRGEQYFGRAFIEVGNTRLATEHLNAAQRIADTRTPLKFAPKIQELKNQIADDLRRVAKN